MVKIIKLIGNIRIAAATEKAAASSEQMAAAALSLAIWAEG
ncbi:hypothetical protein [Paenibacillus agricola]|nr:hypothetical protein [Paenibacillus agricola]